MADQKAKFIEVGDEQKCSFCEVIAHRDDFRFTAGKAFCPACRTGDTRTENERLAQLEESRDSLRDLIGRNALHGAEVPDLEDDLDEVESEIAALKGATAPAADIRTENERLAEFYGSMAVADATADWSGLTHLRGVTERSSHASAVANATLAAHHARLHLAAA